MNILVTGATGFAGKRLVEVLLKKEHNIKCIARETSNISHLKKLDVEILEGSLLDKSFLSSIKNIDMVFHLAALRGEKYLPYSEYEKINVKATENLLEIFEKSKFIYCSTVGVIGYGTDLSEKSPLKPKGNYHITKAEGEKLCWKRDNCIIVRPSIIYGPGDNGFLYKLINMIDKGKFIIIGTGQNKIHLVHIDNLAEGMIEIGMKGKAGETYIVADKKALTVEEIKEIIEKTLNKKILNIKIPGLPVYLLSLIYEKIYSYLFPGKEPFLSSSKVDIISLSQSFNIKKALAAGYGPKINTEEGIKEQIVWMKKEKKI